MTISKDTTHKGNNFDFKGKFLVIGCGSIGKRHIHNLLNIGIKNIVAVDIQRDCLIDVQKEFKIDVSSRLETALDTGVKAALICTPPASHISNALLAADVGSHLFIEKPLSNSLNGVDELIRKVKKNNLVTLVGCNYRFHPGIQRVKSLLQTNEIGDVISARAHFGQSLPAWHPWEDYRNGYSAQKTLGGGVTLDRIHEFDYLCWLLNDVKEVFSFTDHLSKLEIDTEDISEVLLRFYNGAIASIHLDYIRPIYECSLDILGEEGIIQWNSQDNYIKCYTVKKMKWEIIKWEDYDENAMYIEEMRHFLRVLNGDEESINDVSNGKKTLQIALAAKDSAKKGKVIPI